MLKRLKELNSERVSYFGHTLQGWNPLEWAGALCGEAGEAANICKKIVRIDQGLGGNESGITRDGLVGKLGKELADIIIYADLLATREGIDLEFSLKEKFNEVSKRVGFPKELI